jgi:hypothetical protein
MKTRILVFLLFLMTCGSAAAQNYSGDARKIAMGGTGYSENIAVGMIEEERDYRSIAIPLGVIQMIRDREKFYPDNEDIFDPILAMEYAANPVYYGFDRDSGGAQGRFVSDIINAEFSRDLNDYRGFNLTNHLSAQGLLSPSWGKTFKVVKKDNGTYHGFYVGAGPYISVKSDLNIDEELTDVLSSPTYVSIPNRNFEIDNQTMGQLALAITGGYRARFNLPGRKNPDASSRNGIYIAMNYHYLWGFRYEDMDLAVQLDTDSEGLLTVMPATSPLEIYYLNSRSGRGFALDFGAGVMIDGWEFGFGANGVANRIDWEDRTLKRFSLESVLDGGEFVEEWIPTSSADFRVELPVQYVWNIGYNRKAVSVAAEVTRGYQGTAFHAGAEFRLRVIEFRGGMRYALDRWHPTSGIGLNLGKKFSIDVAALWSTTNVERRFKPGLAVSIRLNRPKPSND